MATDLNTVVLIGRLTRDPEFKMVGGSNSSLVNFTLANNRVYVSSGEKKEETNYFDCVAWGKLAEIVKDYTSKGKQILVEGRLIQESWDTNDGKKASRIKIRVENLQLLGAKMGATNNQGLSPQSFQVTNALEDSFSEIPAEDIF